MSKELVTKGTKTEDDPKTCSTSPSNRLIRTLLASTALISVSNVFAQSDDVIDAVEGEELVQAQNDADANSDASENVVEEVVAIGRKYRGDEQTTATGLQMKLIDTPQSISILTPEMMEVAGASSIYDAVTLLPGVVDSGRGFGRDRVLIRGNTVFNHRINGSDMRTFRSLDGYMIDHIEVVRGPATVLYGVASNFGGEINQILKSPQNEFATQVGFEAGDFDMERYTFDVTGAFPSSDGRLQGRITGSYEDSGSFVDVSPTIDNQYSTVLGSLAYDFSPQTRGTAYYYQAKVDEDPFEGGFTRQLPDPGCAERSCRSATLAYDVPAERWYFSDPRHSLLHTDYSFFMAELDHELSNDWDFKSQFTHSKYDQQISYYYPFGPAGAYGLGDDEIYQYSFDENTEAAEVTFNMSLGGEFEAFDRPWEFHAAFQYQDLPTPQLLERLRSVYVGIINIFEGGLGVLSDGTPWADIDRSILPVVRRSFSERESYTGSIQVVAHPTDRLQILAGFLVEKADELGTTTIRGTVLDEPVLSPYKFTESVPRLGITYDLFDEKGPMSDGKLYFSYSEGFRSNGAIFDNDGRLISKPQLMDQIEAGFKFELMDGNLGGSIAWYDATLENIPVSSSFLGGFATSGGVLQGTNQMSGIELELVGQPKPGWNIAANYSNTDTKITDPNFNFVTQIQGVPEHAGAVTSSYEFLDGSAQGLIIGGAVSYVGDREFVNGINRQDNFGTLVTDAFTRVDLYASYYFQSGTMAGSQLYANIENAFDKDYFHTPIAAHPGFNLNRGIPRRITAGFRYNFK